MRTRGSELAESTDYDEREDQVVPLHSIALEPQQQWHERQCNWMVGRWDGKLQHSYPKPQEEMFMTRSERSMNDQLARYALVGPIYDMDMQLMIKQETRDVRRPQRLAHLKLLFDGTTPIHQYIDQWLTYHETFNTYYYWLCLSLRDGSILDQSLQSKLHQHRQSRRWQCLTRRDVDKRNVKECVFWLEELILCYLVLFGQDTPVTSQAALEKIQTLTLPGGQSLTEIHKLFLDLKSVTAVLSAEHMTLSKLVAYMADAILRTGGRYAEANCERFRQFIDFRRALLEKEGPKSARTWHPLEWLEDMCLELADNEEQRASQRAALLGPLTSRGGIDRNNRRQGREVTMHSMHYNDSSSEYPQSIDHVVDASIYAIWEDEEEADEYFREGKLITPPKHAEGQPLWALLHEMSVQDIMGVTEEPAPRRQQITCPVCGMAGHDKISVCRVATDSGKISLDAMSYIRPDQRDYRWLAATEFGVLRDCSAEQLQRIKQRTQEIADTRIQMRQQRGYGSGRPAYYGAGGRGYATQGGRGGPAGYSAGGRGYMPRPQQYPSRTQQPAADRSDLTDAAAAATTAAATTATAGGGFRNS